jgi:prolyl-tRNA editing enzyme YbaK/EbsC (Cys-tRNA(Pro) deacylase)
MSFESAKTHLEKYNLDQNIIVLEDTSATVQLAAKALHCEPAHIAKTLAFLVKETPIVIVMAGDAQISNPDYKHTFGKKAKMLSYDQTLEATSHPVGGVCPFGLKPDVKVYLDESLKRFETVFPACGSTNSAVKLTVSQLEEALPDAQWVDVCKGWREEA